MRRNELTNALVISIASAFRSQPTNSARHSATNTGDQLVQQSTMFHVVPTPASAAAGVASVDSGIAELEDWERVELLWRFLWPPVISGSPAAEPVVDGRAPWERDEQERIATVAALFAEEAPLPLTERIQTLILTSKLVAVRSARSAYFGMLRSAAATTPALSCFVRRYCFQRLALRMRTVTASLETLERSAGLLLRLTRIPAGAVGFLLHSRASSWLSPVRWVGDSRRSCSRWARHLQ
jgi:hypothetical protein